MGLKIQIADKLKLCNVKTDIKWYFVMGAKDSKPSISYEDSIRRGL